MDASVGTPPPPGESITVLIAAEDPIMQVGLRAVLDEASDCRPVGAVGDETEVRGAVERHSPDVLLLDAIFRRRDADLVSEIAREFPRTRVLVLVEHSEEECALRSLLQSTGGKLSDRAIDILDDCCLVALRSSAWGCVARGSGPDRLLKAVRTVAGGEIAAAPWLSAVLGRDRQPRGNGQGERPITARELEVMALVARGLSNRDVADALDIREQTVKNHVGRIMQKLGLESRLEIGLFAAKHHVNVTTNRSPAD